MIPTSLLKKGIQWVAFALTLRHNKIPLYNFENSNITQRNSSSLWASCIYTYILHSKVPSLFSNRYLHFDIINIFYRQIIVSLYIVYTLHFDTINITIIYICRYMKIVYNPQFEIIKIGVRERCMTVTIAYTLQIKIINILPSIG